MRSSSILALAVCLAAVLFFVPRPQTAGAADPPALHYGFQQGKHYVYDVKLEAEVAEEKVNRATSFDFTVQSASDEQFTLRRSGTLSERLPRRRAVYDDRPEQPQGIPGIFIPQFGPPMPMQPVPFGRPQPFGPGRNRFGRPQRTVPAEPQSVPETTFTRSGEMVIQHNRDSLPFLLGYEDMLAIEPFPKKPTASWDKKNDVVVVRDEIETSRAAKEEVQYTVAETKGTNVRLTKKYSLKTEPNIKGVSFATMTGNGDLQFDAKAGLFKSLDMKYTLAITYKSVSITIPVTLSYRYVTEEEAAQRREKARLAAIEARKRGEALAAKQKKEAEAAAEAAKPKPLTPAMRSEALKDLCAADMNTVKAAAKRLAHSLPGDNPDEISAALVHAMKGADDWSKGEFLDALAVWGTNNCERAVIEATKSGTWFIRDKALDILGKKFKNQAAIDALAAQFRNSRGVVAAGLKKIGPEAEEATLPFAKDTDFWLRNEALGVLAEIGGQKSLRALKHELQKTFAHGNPLETGPFNNAIAAIERRLPSDDDADGDTPGEPKMRTWQDATGKFQVDAVLLSVKDEKATLKKKDGKLVTVPVDKLSDEDQDYLKSHNKPKAVNPFE